MKVVYAGEEMPEIVNKSLFLAGPTPRSSKTESWRKDALQILEDKGFDGVVFIPEPREGKFKHSYDDQVEWEDKYLNIADCIVFWVPRDLSVDSDGIMKFPAFTTNVEFGAWCNSGKIVFGAPDLDDPKNVRKNKYLKTYAEKYNVPISHSLAETMDSAMEMVSPGYDRVEGERYVPMMIWKLPNFQNWYRAQQKAGNSLKKAKLLYTFRPGYKSFVFLWILKVEVFIASENRIKDNEFVLSRTDISSIMLWKKELPLEDSQMVLIKEFRSPAATSDGFIYELPGGSSKSSEDALDIAAEEIHEETGLYIKPDRFVFHQARQLAGTLSAHQSYLYSVLLTQEEIDWFLSQKDVVHGLEEDSERTFIEVIKIKDLLNNKVDVDWTTVGQALTIYFNALNDE